jgi:hypothetical protein
MMFRSSFPQLPMSLCVLLTSSMALAQPWRINRTLEWSEVLAGTTTPVLNPNGILDPGESALLRVSATFSPPVGSLVVGVGPVGEATVKGLAQTVFSLGPVEWEEEQGTWEHLTAAPSFTPHLLNPGSTGFIHGGVLQESQGGAWMPDPINPIPDLFQIIWTPFSYEPRHLDMRLGAVISPRTQLWAQYGVDPTTGHPLLTRFSISNNSTVIQIPIAIPAPNAALFAFLSLGTAGAFRRRR